MTPDRLKPQKTGEKLFLEGEKAKARYRQLVGILNTIGDQTVWPTVVLVKLAEDGPSGLDCDSDRAQLVVNVNASNYYNLILCPAQLQGPGFLTLYVEHPPKELTAGKNPRAPVQRARVGFITAEQWVKYWREKQVATNDTPENINTWFRKFDQISVLEPERYISKNPVLFQKFMDAISELEEKAKQRQGPK